MQSQAPTPDSNPDRVASRLAWIGLAVVIAFLAAVQVRLLRVPLDRDEGEYAYMAQLWLDGIPPYAAAYNMKLPGIYAVYTALLWLFGQSEQAVHLGLLIVNAGTTLMMFLIARRVGGAFMGFSAAAFYVVLALSRAMEGFSANAERFAMLPALIGVWILVEMSRVRRMNAPGMLAAGLGFGLAYVTKQQAIVFAGIGLFYAASLAIERRVSARTLIVGLSAFVLGLVIPFALTCAAMYWLGVFEAFWLWTFQYASTYVTAVEWQYGYRNLVMQLSRISKFGWLPWLLALAGLVLTLTDRRHRKHLWLILGLVACGLAGASWGLYFRPHYFMFLSPAVALLAAIALAAAARQYTEATSVWLRYGVPAGLLVMVFGSFIVEQRTMLFEYRPVHMSRLMFGVEPFPESAVLGQYLQANTSPTDRVAVIGSEPQIYFYARRKSASGYIYLYAMLEEQPFSRAMQADAIRQIEEARPAFIVYANNQTSWRSSIAPLNTDAKERLMRWFNCYRQDHYQRVAVIEPASDPYQSRFIWDPPGDYRPAGENWLEVFRRRPEATRSTVDDVLHTGGYVPLE